jgi:hypothetical protein
MTHAHCPDCGTLRLKIGYVAPHNHERSDGWQTKTECSDCEYESWAAV